MAGEFQLQGAGGTTGMAPPGALALAAPALLAYAWL